MKEAVLLNVLSFKVPLAGDNWIGTLILDMLVSLQWVLGIDKTQLQEGFQIHYSCCVEEVEE